MSIRLRNFFSSQPCGFSTFCLKLWDKEWKSRRVVWKIFPREVLRVIRPSWGAQPQKKRKTIRLFQCLTDFGVQKLKRIRLQNLPRDSLEIFQFWKTKLWHSPDFGLWNPKTGTNVANLLDKDDIISNAEQIQLTNMRPSAVELRALGKERHCTGEHICHLDLQGIADYRSLSIGFATYKTIYGVGRTITSIQLSNLYMSNIKGRCDNCVVNTLDCKNCIKLWERKLVLEQGKSVLYSNLWPIFFNPI